MALWYTEMKFWLVFFVVSLLLSAQAWAEKDRLRIVVLDVKEGQSVLLVKNNKGLLIDTGHFGTTEMVMDSMKSHDVIDLEQIILTHLHPDHASGIFNLMQHFPEAIITESGFRSQENLKIDSMRWVADALDSGKWQVRRTRQGYSFHWRNCLIKILWPASFAGGNSNSLSIVAHIVYGDKHVLVMGDSNLEVEEKLLQNGLLPANIDILIVGHHGADDATGRSFLRHTHPQHAVISINKDNIRGYPAESVIKRIRKNGTLLQMTHEQGDVVFHLVQ